MSFRELALEVNVSSKPIHNILTDILGMKRVAARLVPKELNFIQKDYRKQVARMKRIITGDKAWA